MYSPTLGRFVTTDPIGFQAGDVNLYRFVSNDPLNATDPSGLTEIAPPPRPVPFQQHPSVKLEYVPDRDPLITISPSGTHMSYYWPGKWKLSGLVKEGYIIQHVIQEYGFQFTELWPVDANGKINYSAVDIYASGEPAAYSSLSVHGYAVYVSKFDYQPSILGAGADWYAFTKFQTGIPVYCPGYTHKTEVPPKFPPGWKD